MPFFEEMMEGSSYIRTHLQQIAAASVSTASCGGASNTDADDAECRDEAAALRLKMVAVAAILVAGATGVAIPLVGRRCRGRGGGASSSSGSFSSSPSAGGAFVLVKAFAAGVILATGFVHMLHDADEALTDPCLPAAPWRRFPFPGFVAMLAALATLVFDFVGTHMYESKQHSADAAEAAAAAGNASVNASGHDVTAALLEDGALAGSVASGIGYGALMGSVGSSIGYSALMGSVGSSIGGGHMDPMHIVGMRAHAAAHRHSYSHGIGPCDDGHNGNDEEPSQARHVVVSQILELGIVSHSVIIGLSLGVSQNPCTIKPLVAALSFHQFFEGFALGGCISEVNIWLSSRVSLHSLWLSSSLSQRLLGSPWGQVSRPSTTPTARGHLW
ncbi:hypothetical protein BDA96_10G225500 [Sorghum bicolor]|uniref:Uncharacterized protein n=2 Tax=Sorghum bicolor TaxID=4558 RepID=A0A194YJR5_SORBI|nr:zinc transporter 10 isoform X3 [Sorghum bicolor]KAG0514811.1 hypothetical protein BDA96_10G225500 [Sorghum bicolor]KXG20214.1 hypothetical protein SORBI_3010G171300 [Sorghum bicolor]OQU76593.1 hypothetical protein SORBI_3010G171300 [Sorghum bicolor]OQU76594.1 hypothetical protein SORBI_3010G171300 [Sorghum bicolor]|eukprot:XP_002437176.2 zinc transporter 10 isoform X3 [Sorghum bicolor]